MCSINKSAHKKSGNLSYAPRIIKNIGYLKILTFLWEFLYDIRIFKVSTIPLKASLGSSPGDIHNINTAFLIKILS